MSNRFNQLSDEQQQALKDLAAVISTLAEVGGTAPAVTLYMALGNDINRYDRVRAVAENQGWATSTSTTMTLTPLGMEKGTEIVKAWETGR